MAATPPAQIRGEARTPPTPLHGSAYHSETPSRYNFRSRKTPSTNDSPRSSRTPRSPARQDLHFHSPQATPKRTSRRTQVISPASPNSDNESMQHRPQNPSYLTATTILSEGMLPTPVKTPQKKQLPKSSMARALFQDAADTPRKTQKRKMRHNGFSLESFSENTNGGVQIHVDSRDQVPEVDTTEDNPFYAAESSNTSKKRSAPVAHKVAGTPKRRKVETEKAEKKPLDPQVEDAIEKDEGMVYVFRGKKVYRRFDDNGDEEEVIDAEDLGLLGDQPDGTEIVQPLKTLTRKSIKPRRLFQSENKKTETPHIDEDADTEVEEEQSDIASPSKSKAAELVASEGPAKRKRGSPFDSWVRMKPGSRSVSATKSTGRKRTAAEALGA